MPGAQSAETRSLEVLRGVDFDLHSGEMVSIVGQSGTGKSTLLHIIGTLDTPTSGTVAYHGQDVFALPEAKMAAFRNERIGFIFQFHHLLAEFTAIENAMLPALIQGLKRKEATERAAALLHEVGLDHRLEHKPGELSGGEQQRVAVARALVMNPDVVFADEPTGNLDSRTSDEIHHLLVKLNAKKGTAFVVVTHNVRLAWLMQRHLLLAGGTVRTLTDDEAPEEFLPRKHEEHGG
ncbi:MAG: ABC transporter ATP-binding protein [Myxococcota bacterium]|nr:ABC transporter ATP-binding protein [Myxococcota bacterium]